MERENGASTIEPLVAITAEEQDTCTIYARQNELLEDGWRQFRKIAKREKTLLRQVNPVSQDSTQVHVWL